MFAVVDGYTYSYPSESLWAKSSDPGFRSGVTFPIVSADKHRVRFYAFIKEPGDNWSRESPQPVIDIEKDRIPFEGTYPGLDVTFKIHY